MGLLRLAHSLHRPFQVVPKSDGRPAVRVEIGDKTQEFVSGYLCTGSIY